MNRRDETDTERLKRIRTELEARFERPDRDDIEWLVEQIDLLNDEIHVMTERD